MTTSWDVDLAKRVGKAIKHHRETRTPKLSAAKLADRASEIGYEVTKATISELELGRKRSVTVAELIALARALDIPPVELLFPALPDGEVEVWPGFRTRSIAALQWFSGEVPAWLASDYTTTLAPDEQDRQSAGLERVERARELEKNRLHVSVGLEASMAGYDLEVARRSGDELTIEHAKRKLEAAKRAEAELRRYVAQLMAAMISRGMTVEPREGHDDVYEEALELVRASRKSENSGETTASASDPQD